jgi:uncharacterized protein
MIELLLLFAAVGLVSGLIAGLFGLGGGVVIVPVLLYTFAQVGYSSEILTHLAIGTSLGCIVITSISSSRTHWQKGAVKKELVLPMVPGVLVGGWLGGVWASHLSGLYLQLAFAGFMVFVAITMLMTVSKAYFSLPGRLGLSSAGLIIGSVASLFGVGGGSMTVPYLSLCGVPMARAVATSAVLGGAIAVSGVISYVVQGWGNPQLPEYSSGYLYWPAFVGIVVCSAPAARFGAKLAHRLPADKLQRAFAVVLLLIAAEIFISSMAG